MRATVRQRTVGSRRKRSTGAASSRAMTKLRRAEPQVWKALLEKHGGTPPPDPIPQDPTVSSRLYGLTEAAKAIGVESFTLREWRNRGYLHPSYCFKGRSTGKASMEPLYTDADIRRGMQLKEKRTPGRSPKSEIGWKEVQRRAEAEFRSLFPEQYRAFYEQEKA